MLKKVFLLLLSLSLAISLLSGCSSNSKSPETSGGTPGQEYDKTIHFSVASLMVTIGADFEDALYQELNDRYNFTMEVVPLTWDDYQQKPRIWLASGDAPDVFTWDFNYTDYKNYVEQELIEPLPKDYAQRYPNLANALNQTSLTKFLEDKNDGVLYAVPHVAYMDPPTDVVLSHPLIYYRKDWASQVGMNIGESATLDEVFELARKFISQDPGNNGSGNTIGLTSRSYFLNEMILRSFNNYYASFERVGNEYKWGPGYDATLDGLRYFKSVYDEGLLDRDYYINTGKDFYDKFYSGRAGMMFGEGHGNEQNIIKNEFEAANPGLDDALGVAVVLANDGKWRGSEQANFWTASLFRKGIDKETQERILAIMDYLCSDEGYRFIRLGVEGEDYKEENGEIVITREKDPSTGQPINIMDLYPSQRVWVFHSVLDDQWGLINPELPAESRQKVIDIFKLKEEKGDIQPIDWALNLFTAPNYDKFKLDFANEYPAMITKPGDLENNFREWVATHQPMVDVVLQELNEGLK